ncbi:SDR family NAD(P)-dependent oxidoreductase [Nocardia sp. NPDC052566]|uniref:SDR family NAD(P)-dependent oxidoreductase n=1 Tax=Nocardia sp. NPDC052566 TaxID=3364330 RepID=UPI0037CAD2E1
MRAMVTGASAGIGRAAARSLAAAGYSVTLVARREDLLIDLLAELGPGHDYLVADLGAPAGLASAAELLRARHYTVLVNNAGTAAEGDFAVVSLESATATVDLNCQAVVALAHAFLAAARPGDTMVNVASTLGLTPKPGLAVYSATKAFVIAFSAALWHEQRDRDIRVFALCPGVTVTESQTAEDVPPWLVQTPEQVADRALAAIVGRSGPIAFTSPANRVFGTALALLPRRVGMAVLAS